MIDHFMFSYTIEYKNSDSNFEVYGETGWEFERKEVDLEGGIANIDEW